MLFESLLADVEPVLATRRIADVRIGLGYTAVLLDDGGCGLASTVLPAVQKSCTLLADAGELIDRRAIDLAVRTGSNDTISAGLGLATINAALNRKDEPDPGLESCVDLEGAVVGMIGYIPPIAIAIRSVAAQLHVFDRRTVSNTALGDMEIERLLPTCDVALLTSQTLVNGTAERLLEIARGLTIALIGPSTPMWNGFASFGVSYLFGQLVCDPQIALRIVGQAGGTRRFRGAARKIFRALTE